MAIMAGMTGGRTALDLFERQHFDREIVVLCVKVFED
jgi:hypothetical protein